MWATASLGLAAGLAAWASVSTRHAVVPVTGLAALGVGVLALALLFGRAGVVAPSLVLVGFGYGLSRVGQGVGSEAPLYGAGLLAVAELAYWTLELRQGRGAPSGPHRPRWVLSAALVAASIMLGGAELVIAQGVWPAGPGWEVMATLGAIGVLGLLTGVAGCVGRR